MAPKHAAKPVRRTGLRVAVLAGAAVVVAGAIAAAVALVPTTTSTPTAGAAEHGHLRVVSVTPRGNWVSPDTPFRVLFNNPISTGSPMPSITPAVPGSWVQLSPSTISFRAAASLVPGRSYRIVVPSTTVTTGGRTLGTAVARRVTVAYGSTLRLQQILAQLGFMPVKFVPTGQFSPASSAVQKGTFSWRWATVPQALTRLWQPGVFDVITKGALMRFEDAHGLPTLQSPNPAAWGALLDAVAHGKVSHDSYNYVDVGTSLPQTLTLYVNMRPIYRSLVNTGIPQAPTAIQTDPVYLRFVTTTMRGTNPDGSTYNDPGIPWVSYFKGGEALHGFIRGTYGWPQSLGCIEMTFDAAKAIFPYTPIGTLVTIR